VPPETTEAQFREMLGNLIIDRFGLKYHTETKETPGYALAPRQWPASDHEAVDRSSAVSLGTRFGTGKPGSTPDSVESLPGIFTAVPSQLGLKLERKKIAAVVMVVDHMDKTPRAN